MAENPPPGAAGPRDDNPYAPPLSSMETPPVQVAMLAGGDATKRSPRQWEALIRQRIRRGESASHVLHDVVNEGLPPQEAQRLVDAARASARQSGIIVSMVGLLFILGGGCVTAGSFASASNDPRGEFVIWFGPVIFGFVLLIVGIVKLLRLPS